MAVEPAPATGQQCRRVGGRHGVLTRRHADRPGPVLRDRSGCSMPANSGNAPHFSAGARRTDIARLQPRRQPIGGRHEQRHHRGVGPRRNPDQFEGDRAGLDLPSPLPAQPCHPRRRTVQVEVSLGEVQDREVYSRILALSQGSPGALHRRGLAYLRFHQWQEAFQDFSRVLDLQPDHIDAHYPRGLIHAPRPAVPRGVPISAASWSSSRGTARRCAVRGCARHSYMIGATVPSDHLPTEITNSVMGSGPP